MTEPVLCDSIFVDTGDATVNPASKSLSSRSCQSGDKRKLFKSLKKLQH